MASQLPALSSQFDPGDQRQHPRRILDKVELGAHPPLQHVVAAGADE
jgi:hypothetical protein